MTEFDPREDPFYNGPELNGLSPDERFDLAKQLRIVARNRRISKSLIKRAAEQRQLRVFDVVGAIVLITFGMILLFGMLK